MTPQVAKKILIHPYLYVGMPMLNTEELFKKIEDITGVCKSAILGKSRQKIIREARQIFSAYCRLEMGLTQPHIGRILGQDHTTVLYTERIMKTEIEMGTELGKLYKLIR